MMPGWEKLRVLVLAVTFGTTLGVLGLAVLGNAHSYRQIATTFIFPKSVSLPEWQQAGSRPQNATVEHDLLGRHYQYQKNNLPLDIEMLYLPDTGGNINQYIRTFASVPSSSLILDNIKYQPGIGFYSLFTYRQKVYLSACINSHGGSTVTDRQFSDNHQVYNLQLGRLLPWLLNQGTHTDRRCLVTLMSIPLKEVSTQQADSILSTTWFSWYHRWATRFPPT